MRKAILIVVGIGLAAITLSGCAPASSGGSGGAAGGSSGGSSASGGASSASGPTGAIDLCTVFSASRAVVGKRQEFQETVKTNSDGVYGCEYNAADGSYDWVLAVREPSGGENPTNDGLDLGGPSAVKPINGVGYPAVGDKAGVSVQFGKDIVEVYTPSTASAAQATTAQFVAVAKAVIAAVSK